MNATAAARLDPRGAARRSPTAGNRNQGYKWLHPATRRRIYERDRWCCVWCRREVAQLGMRGVKGVSVEGIVFTDGMKLKQASIDHAIPRSRGGSNNPTNLITCCAACNAARGDERMATFAMHQACGSRELAEATVRRIRNARRRKLPVLALHIQRT